MRAWLVKAAPNTNYNFFLKCHFLLGVIKTDATGHGNNTFTFPTNVTGPVYAFDMYPDGAPLGNKYQSVQINFQGAANAFRASLAVQFEGPWTVRTVPLFPSRIEPVTVKLSPSPIAIPPPSDPVDVLSAIVERVTAVALPALPLA